MRTHTLALLFAAATLAACAHGPNYIERTSQTRTVSRLDIDRLPGLDARPARVSAR